MVNPFEAGQLEAAQEAEMVAKAQRGDAKAMEDLIKLHQPWVFNIVLRMVSDYHEAEDLSQEIILKSFTKISSFKGTSRFSTWLYRIAVNHVLSMKKTNSEKQHEKYSKKLPDNEQLNAYFDQEIQDPKTLPGDHSLIVKEIMIKCMLGMLLCLNRKQRIVIVLGHILGVNGKTASAILDMSEDNFRKSLSRSRHRLFNFLNDRCSLVNPGRPCTCERCVIPSLNNGYVDPLKLVFNAKDAPAIRDIISHTKKKLDNVQYERCQELYREHPLQESPDFSKRVVEILRSSEVQTFLNTASGA